MAPEIDVLRFYVLCNRLKNLIRTGWKNWHVCRERIESVAEHVYSAQMLAIAMCQNFKYDIDLFKVIYMLAIHELEETMIGDYTQFDISREEKEKLGHEAIKKALGTIASSDYIEKLILEFDERKTKEADFAYHIDKLECDLQCKLYDEEACVDIDVERDRGNIHDETVLKLLDEGKSWSEMWMTFGQKKYGYDENFLKVSNYAMEHDIGILAQF